MRSSLTIVRLFIAVFLLASAHAGETAVIPLAGTWEVRLGAYEQDGAMAPINLPGSLDQAGFGRPNAEVNLGTWSRRFVYEGPAVFQRTVEIPTAWAGQRVTLFLERTKITRTWLDGRLLGTHDSLINPHRYDLGAVSSGSHLLAIEVDNTRKKLPPEMWNGVLESHQISGETQTNWNGIVGRLELQADPPVSLARVVTYPDTASRLLHIRAEVMNATGKAAAGRLVLAVRAAEGALLPTVERAWECPPTTQAPAVVEAEIPVPVGALAGWNELNPVLHDLTASLDVGGSSSTRHIRFGWRSFTRAGSQFAIDGVKVLLRGESDNAVFPLTGYAPMDGAEWKRQMEAYTAFGINHLRFHSWAPPRSALEAADAAGIYLQPELPAWTQIHGDWLGTERSRAYYTREAREYLLENGNSPSFVMLSLGNELIVNTKRELFDREKDRLYDFLDSLRTIDRTRLYAEQTGWAAPSPRNDYFCSFGLYNVGDIRSFYTQGTTFTYTDRVAKNPALPLIVAEVGQYNVFPDAGREGPKYTGVLEARNLASFHARACSQGLGPLIPAFERASCAHAAMLYAYEVENYLRTPGLGGFQLLNLKDFPGQGSALCGLLDAFLAVKPGVDVERFRDACGPVTLLPSLQRLAWTSDQTLEAEAIVANYGLADLEGLVVRWTLREEATGRELGTGTLTPGRLPQGAPTSAGTIRQDLSAVTVPAQLVLHLEAVGLQVGGRPVRNARRCWIYPPATEAAIPPGMLVARGMTATARRHLAGGGTVVVLPIIDERRLPHSVKGHFRFGFWWGAEPMGLLIQHHHPFFRRFPASEHNDFQWLNLLGLKRDPRCRGIVLTGAPAGFQPLVTMIPSYKSPELLGLLFEARCGGGRVLACGFDVLGQLNKPEVRQFHAALLDYAASPDFRPEHELSLSRLTELIRGDDLVITAVRSNDPALRYEGVWIPDGVDAKKGTERGRSTTQVGASVSWTFTGTGVAVTSRRDKLGSSYEVYIDGARAGRAELYEDSSEGVSDIIFGRYDLPPGQHEIRLVLSEYRHPGSMGPRGWIQHIESLSPAP